jgi:hypothetical protein
MKLCRVSAVVIDANGAARLALRHALRVAFGAGEREVLPHMTRGGVNA